MRWRAAAFVVSLLVASLGALPEQAVRRLTVAVADFEARGFPADQGWMGPLFSDGLTNILVSRGQVRIVERRFLSQILAELELHMTGMVTESTAVEAGAVIGADAFVFGVVALESDGMVSASARVVRVGTSEVMAVAAARGSTDDIRAVQRAVAAEFHTRLAIRSAVGANPGAIEAPVPIGVDGELRGLVRLADGLPVLGLDPARARRRGDYATALSTARAIAGAFPDLADARYYLALFSLHNEDYLTAAEEARAAVERGCGIEGSLLQANVLFCTGEIDSAAACLKSTVERFPDDARGWYALGKVLVRKRDKVRAAVAFIEAAGRAPYVPEAETNLRAILSEPSGTEVRRALRAQGDPHWAPAELYLAYWRRSESYDGEAISSTVRDFPGFYIGYFATGIVESGRHRQAEAVSWYRKCLALQPSFPYVHRNLAACLFDLDECATGRRHVAIYLKTAPVVDDYAGLELKMQRCSR